MGYKQMKGMEMYKHFSKYARDERGMKGVMRYFYASELLYMNVLVKNNCLSFLITPISFRYIFLRELFKEQTWGLITILILKMPTRHQVMML